MRLPPDLRLLPPSDEAAQGWTWEPLWLCVVDEGVEVHTLVNAWSGLWDEIAAEAAQGALEVDGEGGPGAM